MATFEEATTVEGGDGQFTAELDPEWTIGGKPHGGYLLALLARAAIATEHGAHPHPLAANAVYLTPPQVGPARVEVEALRLGRSASQLRARLVQDDQPRVEALFTLGRLEPDTEPRWVDAPPVPVAPEPQCHRTSVEPRNGIRVGMAGLVEQRIDLGSLTVAKPADAASPGSPPPGGSPSGSPAATPRLAAPAAASAAASLQRNGLPAPAGTEGSGEIRGWLRFADGSAFDPVSLLYAADGFPPATFTIGSVGWVPTLTLTVYLRAIPAPGALRVRQRARVLTGSFVDQVCELWDERDQIVAQATQLAAVRMGPPAGPSS